LIEIGWKGTRIPGNEMLLAMKKVVIGAKRLRVHKNLRTCRAWQPNISRSEVTDAVPRR